MPLIILKYFLPSGTSGAVLAAGAWTQVPVNGIVRNDNNICVLNTDGTFTLTTNIFPKICRFNISTGYVNTSAGNAVVKGKIEKIVGATPFLIDTSINMKVLGTVENQGFIKQFTAYELERSSTFKVSVWSDRAGVFGRPATDGSEERYATIEITIE